MFNEKIIESAEKDTKEIMMINDNVSSDMIEEETINIEKEPSIPIKVDDEASSSATDAAYDAPRTWNHEYNKIDLTSNRYFVYSSSGGFNNQRAILEYAIWISRYLNRTLIIPMAGKHTQMWYKHEELLPQHLFPMDRLLDIRVLERIYLQSTIDNSDGSGQPTASLDANAFSSKSPYVVLNISVPLFIKDLERRNIDMHTMFHYQTKQWTQKDLEQFKGIKSSILYFKGGEMYHRWGFPAKEMEFIQRHVVYSPAIRKLAIDLSRSFSGPFNAVHIRLGDYTGRTPSSVSFLNKMLQGYSFNTTYPLYIATEPTSSISYFKPILDKFPRVVFSKNLPNEPIMKFKSIFPPGQIRNDMLGILEQLLCVAAKKFVPTDFSTFSAWINFMRKHKEDSFPESVKLRNQWEELN